MKHLNNYNSALREFLDSLINVKLSTTLAYYDIIQRYKRSKIGQFWITITTAVLTLGMTLIFSSIFGIDTKFYLLYITLNFIIWMFIRDTTIEACSAFISANNYLKNGKWNYFIFTNKIIFKNLFIFFHNFILVIFVCFYSETNFTFFNLIFSFISFCNLIFLLMGSTMFVAILATRFRDVRMILENIFQLLFFITPIMWVSEMLEGKKAILLDINPIAIILSTINNPLIYGEINFINFFKIFIFSLLVWFITLVSFNIKKRKITTWL